MKAIAAMIATTICKPRMHGRGNIAAKVDRDNRPSHTCNGASRRASGSAYCFPLIETLMRLGRRFA
ncbi:hypothetical protein CCHR01_01819 [Colletotrichum chrysophilum]|uniref:Uncharacterized protein n=1 Tax=Colletotrichum chrysophilum TaxID=1836956 RepID=A0AAD9ENW8_9PEZI|nr:hypothetical protein CCHR01_01819 [Colletotrichum chrysophilum]